MQTRTRDMSWQTFLFSASLFILAPLRAAQAQDVDVPGNLTMVNSTATEGNILKEGVPFIHNFGIGNTFVGRRAGNLTMSGTYNTASGDSALVSNTGGYDNTASGFHALSNNTTGYGNTASGLYALLSNTEGHDNTASGLGALLSNGGGYGNTASGASALYRNTSGSYNTAIGIGADVSVGDLENATAIGSRAVVDASNKIRLGNTSVTVIEGQVGFTASSDRNQKENLEPVDGEEVLTKVSGLTLTSWNFIGHDPKQFRHYGPMAQDFFAAFGHDGMGTIGTETTITSTDIDGILMVAAQALEKRTEALRAENAELKARLEALERRVGRYGFDQD